MSEQIVAYCIVADAYFMSRMFLSLSAGSSIGFVDSIECAFRQPTNSLDFGYLRESRSTRQVERTRIKVKEKASENPK